MRPLAGMHLTPNELTAPAKLQFEIGLSRTYISLGSWEFSPTSLRNSASRERSASTPRRASSRRGGSLHRGSVRRRPRNPSGRITVPMLVLAGSDDPVVPLAQAEAMVAAMQAAGAVVEHHVYEGEGHGFRRLVNVIDELERTTAFCERVVRC